MITQLNKFIIENKNPFTYDDVEHWISGECIPFTVALNEIFPKYKIAVLNDEFDIDDFDIEYNFNFIHALCYHPSNPKIIIDAMGIRDIRSLYRYYHDINPVIDWDIPNSKFLIDNYAGKEFYSEESYEYDEDMYNEAKQWIKKRIEYYRVK